MFHTLLIIYLFINNVVSIYFLFVQFKHDNIILILILIVFLFFLLVTVVVVVVLDNAFHYLMAPRDDKKKIIYLLKLAIDAQLEWF